jgi:hypothetical protein
MIPYMEQSAGESNTASGHAYEVSISFSKRSNAAGPASRAAASLPTMSKLTERVPVEAMNVIVPTQNREPDELFRGERVDPVVYRVPALVQRGGGRRW